MFLRLECLGWTLIVFEWNIVDCCNIGLGFSGNQPWMFLIQELCNNFYATRTWVSVSDFDSTSVINYVTAWTRITSRVVVNAFYLWTGLLKRPGATNNVTSQTLNTNCSVVVRKDFRGFFWSLQEGYMMNLSIVFPQSFESLRKLVILYPVNLFHHIIHEKLLHWTLTFITKCCFFHLLLVVCSESWVGAWLSYRRFQRASDCFY